MSSVVSQYVTKIICGNQGCLDFKQLDQIVGQKFTCANEVLLGILRDSRKYAISEGKEKASGCVMSQDSVIVAKTSLRVCQTSHKECHQCDNLHICSHFVCGNCKYGNKCKKAHSLDCPHNAAIISEVGHHDLGEAELFQLLLQNDPYLMPEICSHYNKRVGEHGFCKFKSSCTKLHLCLHFLRGDCRFGAGCKRAHTFDAPAMKILNSRGFSQENIKILHNIYKNKFIITHQENPAAVAPSLAPVMKPVEKHQPSSSSTSETDRNEICLFSIRSRCSFKDTCVRVHYHLPYKWQILDGVTWRDLDNVEEIEKAYCNPQNDTSGGSKPVNFLTMTCGSPPVRRLSTVSSVTKPPYFILTTEWLWYWRNDCGQWIEYGHEGGEGNVTSVNSQTLETVYQTDSDSEIPFESGDQKYILSLKEMHQQNIRFKTKRAICRRPCFISKEDVNAKLKSESKESSSSSVTVPPHWDKGVLSDDTDYKLVPLSSQIEEYQKLEKLFKNTMASSTIHSIKRIQNPSLWRVYQWQKEQMMKKNGGKPVDERELFHGTDHSIIDVICEQNFDWRTCGVNGKLYGLGSYFARDALYSNAYIRSQSSSKKIMFVVLVLVGEFTNGCRTYRRPPTKSTSKVLYDSCVDSENNPSIFVVFEKQQIYPEYLIEYS